MIRNWSPTDQRKLDELVRKQCTRLHVEHLQAIYRDKPAYAHVICLHSKQPASSINNNNRI
jgi:hypothetical protein